MRNRSGLTLVELMLGSMMVFAAAVTMTAVVVSSTHFLATERERNMGLQLGWQQAQAIISTGYDGLNRQFSAVPAGYAVNSGWGNFSLPLQELNYGQYFGLQPISAQINLPSGRQFTVETIKRYAVLLDVTCSDDDHYIAFAGNVPFNVVHIYDNKAKTLYNMSPMPLITPVPAQQVYPNTPNIERATGLMSDTNFTWLLATDDQRWGFHLYGTPSSSYIWPSGIFMKLPNESEPLGITTTQGGGDLWCVDSNNRCLWHSTNSLSGSWETTSTAPPSPIPALVVPVQIAWDPTLNALWVTDQGNLCLRRYDLKASAWDPHLYRYAGLGVPKGVAVTPAGIFTADNFNLWFCDLNGGNWKSFPLPHTPALGYDGLCYKLNSMHYNLQDNILWINTGYSYLWQLQLGFNGSGQPGDPGPTPVPVPVIGKYDNLLVAYALPQTKPVKKRIDYSTVTRRP